MNIFPWTPDFSVGVFHLDEQHQEMMMLINKLFESLLHGTNTQDVDGYIAKLKSHTQKHFTLEEHTMEVTSYPPEDTARHREIHAKFLQRLNEFETSALRAEGTLELYDLTRELAHYLKAWTIEHLTGEDRKLGRHLNRLGLH